MKKNKLSMAIDKIKEIGGKKLDGSITIRIDNETKAKFEEICASMGLSISSAISTFVNKVINVGGIPFSINIAKKNRKLGIANGKYNIDYEEFDRLDNEIMDMFEV